MKHILIVIPCFNEEDNIEELYKALKKQFSNLPAYRFSILFADNHSTDKSWSIIKTLATTDKNLLAIRNSRNYGHMRSPFHAYLQADADAMIPMVCDFQDPPELIPALIEKWESGYKCVVAVKRSSQESKAMFSLRKFFYRLLNRLSETPLHENFTGFGLFDRKIVQALKCYEDPYPYFRGIISEIGFDYQTVLYDQPIRERGVTKNNFYSLYDMAMLGITTHSVVPLRLLTLGGFLLSILSFFVGIGYLIAKIIFWDYFSVGIAPIIISLFFIGAVQMLFLGIVGEYIATIRTQTLKRPLVIEEERLNFAVPNI